MLDNEFIADEDIFDTSMEADVVMDDYTDDYVENTIPSEIAFCGNCGEEVAADDVLCWNCGADLTKAEYIDGSELEYVAESDTMIYEKKSKKKESDDEDSKDDSDDKDDDEDDDDEDTNKVEEKNMPKKDKNGKYPFEKGYIKDDDKEDDKKDEAKMSPKKESDDEGNEDDSDDEDDDEKMDESLFAWKSKYKAIKEAKNIKKNEAEDGEDSKDDDKSDDDKDDKSDDDKDDKSADKKADEKCSKKKDVLDESTPTIDNQRVTESYEVPKGFKLVFENKKHKMVFESGDKLFLIKEQTTESQALADKILADLNKEVGNNFIKIVLADDLSKDIETETTTEFIFQIVPNVDENSPITVDSISFDYSLEFDAKLRSVLVDKYEFDTVIPVDTDKFSVYKLELKDIEIDAEMDTDIAEVEPVMSGYAGYDYSDLA